MNITDAVHCDICSVRAASDFTSTFVVGSLAVARRGHSSEQPRGLAATAFGGIAKHNDGRTMDVVGNRHHRDVGAPPDVAHRCQMHSPGDCRAHIAWYRGRKLHWVGNCQRDMCTSCMRDHL